MTPAADDVLWQLQHHKTPVTIDDLRLWAHLKRRRVEDAIHELRLAGYPVVSDNKNGIWLSADPDEIRACAKALRRRYITQTLTVRALRNTARRMVAEQAQLWPDAA